MSVKKQEVVMLPTNKSNFGISKNGTMDYITDITSPFLTPQHLYVISNDEIKTGDCVVSKRFNMFSGVYKASYKDAIGWIMEGDLKFDQTTLYFKIVATTDPSLNLPMISKGFIEKYIEQHNINKNINDVLVEYENDTLKIKNNTITIRKFREMFSRAELESHFDEFTKKHRGILNGSDIATLSKFLQELC